MKNWFVIYTRPKQEKKVANKLEILGIESYCPTKVIERNWSDRKKKIEVPLFPSYCFVYVDEKDRNKVFEVSGVVKYLFWLKKPALVRLEEIEEIKRWLSEYSHYMIETRPFQYNDTLVIKSGLFSDKKGTVLKQKRDVLLLSLENLGITLCISQSDVVLSPI